MGKAGLLATEMPREGPPGVFQPEGRVGAVTSTEGLLGTDAMPGVFAMAGIEYANDHGGVGLEQFARVAEKNHAHSTLNPHPQYQKRFTLEEILAAPMIAYPNTSLMCSPTADGAAAAVIVSEKRLRRLPAHTRARAVKIAASVITTDPWNERGNALPDFNTLTRNAAREAYETASVDPADLDLVEFHDCFATSETRPLRQSRALRSGRGGPLHRRTGTVARRHHSCQRVGRAALGEAGARQIDGATVGLARVLGLGNTCAVHILERRSR